jgi:hypothetical protein
MMQTEFATNRQDLPNIKDIDESVEELAKKYNGNQYAILPYWYRYKDEIFEIFEKCYPISEIPKWVNYELFKFEILFEMAETLFTDIVDEYPSYFTHEDITITINFSYILAIAMCSNFVRGDDRIQDRLDYEDFYLTVTYFKGG